MNGRPDNIEKILKGLKSCPHYEVVYRIEDKWNYASDSPLLQIGSIDWDETVRLASDSGLLKISQKTKITDWVSIPTAGLQFNESVIKGISGIRFSR